MTGQQRDFTIGFIVKSRPWIYVTHLLRLIGMLMLMGVRIKNAIQERQDIVERFGSVAVEAHLQYLGAAVIQKCVIAARIHLERCLLASLVHQVYITLNGFRRSNFVIFRYMVELRGQLVFVSGGNVINR